jgi:hypothetical protein
MSHEKVNQSLKLIHGDFSAAGYFTAGMLVWVVGGPV